MESGSKIRNKYTFGYKASVAKINKILAAISNKSLSRRAIAEEIHLTHRYTKLYIDHLLAEKKIYISEWKFENQGNRPMFWPYYRAGNKKNKPKPPNLTRSQKCKRYREKLVKDLDRLDKFNMKRRLRRLVIKPDWSVAWMMNNA